MRQFVCLLCFFTVSSLVCLTSSGAEEWPSYDVPFITLSGGVIAPASPQDSIRMDSMKIDILPQDRSYVVDAVFQLFNTGEATTEWIGFPKHGEADPPVASRNRVIRDFIRFEGWVDGRKELFEEKSHFLTDNRHPFPELMPAGLREETRWMAKEIVFPNNASTTVRIRYEAPYATCSDCSIRPYQGGSFYLGPGKYWKGSIAEVEIVLQDPDTATHHRRMVLRDPGTSRSGKMTRAKTTITIDRRQLTPSANGVLLWSQIPDSKTIRYKD
jgi:hypothetical protein